MVLGMQSTPVEVKTRQHYFIVVNTIYEFRDFLKLKFSGFIVPLMITAMISGDPYSIDSWSIVWYVCAAFAATGKLI